MLVVTFHIILVECLLCMHASCVPSLYSGSISEHSYFSVRYELNWFSLAGFLRRLLVYRQALDVVRHSKVAEVLGSEYAKENNKDYGRRSNSRERVRRDSSDNVSYDRSFGEGDEVSIDKHWSGFASYLVSIHTAQQNCGTIPMLC